MQWMPHHSGLASGIMVAGFGCSAFVFSPIETAFLNPNNYAHNEEGCDDVLLHLRLRKHPQTLRPRRSSRPRADDVLIDRRHFRLNASPGHIDARHTSTSAFPRCITLQKSHSSSSERFLSAEDRAYLIEYFRHYLLWSRKCSSEHDPLHSCMHSLKAPTSRITLTRKPIRTNCASMLR